MKTNVCMCVCCCPTAASDYRVTLQVSLLDGEASGGPWCWPPQRCKPLMSFSAALSPSASLVNRIILSVVPPHTHNLHTYSHMSLSLPRDRRSMWEAKAAVKALIQRSMGKNIFQCFHLTMHRQYYEFKSGWTICCYIFFLISYNHLSKKNLMKGCNLLTQSSAVRGRVRNKQLFAQWGKYYVVASIKVYI